MDFWFKIGICAALFGFNLACSALIWYVLSKQVNELFSFCAGLSARVSNMEKWKGECEAEALTIASNESARLSSQGKKGVEIREDNRAMRQAAMQEGRALCAKLGPQILTDSAMQTKFKNDLIGLARKYPLVANEVGDGLIREFKLEPFKDIIKGVIGEAITAGPQATKEEGPAEGSIEAIYKAASQF